MRPDSRAGTQQWAERGWTLLGSLLVVGLCVGCDEPAASPPKKPAPPAASPSAAPALPAPPAPSPSAAPAAVSSSAAQPEQPAGPRTLAKILVELEEIEATSPNLEDPDADYEARYERVLDMSVEAARPGLKALQSVHQGLIEARKLPEEVGYLQRSSFLARVFARIASSEPEALAETAKLLHTLQPAELDLVFEGLPRGPAKATLAGWLGQLSSPPGPKEGPLRLQVLKRYVKVAKIPDPKLLAILLKDPDPEVSAAARELAR